MRTALVFATLATLALAPGCGRAEAIEVAPAAEQLEGKADAAGGNVELKVTIRADQLQKALSTFQLEDRRASVRSVYFYDTRTLELFAHGLILRARKLKNAPDDSTVKMRPLVASRVAKSWFDLDGFKCEEDRTGTKAVESCSMSAVQDKGEIDDVARGSREIRKLFGADQERFAADYGPPSLPWARLKVLGPIPAKVWKFRVKGFKAPLTAERWTIAGGPDLLEISTKATRAKADATAASLDALLERKGFDTSARQETKTRVALEFFAGR